MAKATLKEEAIRLRVQERKSFDEIRQVVPVSKGTLSVWLKCFPLSASELANRRATSARALSERRQTPSKDPSKWFCLADASKLSTEQKGRIAESAILFRLAVLGLPVLRSVFEGHRTDWVVEVDGRFVGLQVKWVQTDPKGARFVPLRSSGSKVKYTRAAFDFLVGYDLFLDQAFVLSWEDLGDNASAIYVTEATVEAWHKLRQLVAQK